MNSFAGGIIVQQSYTAQRTV